MAGAFRPPASRTFPETTGGVSFLAARSLTAACVEDTFPSRNSYLRSVTYRYWNSPRIAVTAIAGLSLRHNLLVTPARLCDKDIEPDALR